MLERIRGEITNSVSSFKERINEKKRQAILYGKRIIGGFAIGVIGTASAAYVIEHRYEPRITLTAESCPEGATYTPISITIPSGVIIGVDGRDTAKRNLGDGVINMGDTDVTGRAAGRPNPGLSSAVDKYLDSLPSFETTDNPSTFRLIATCQGGR